MAALHRGDRPLPGRERRGVGNRGQALTLLLVVLVLVAVVGLLVARGGRTAVDRARARTAADAAALAGVLEGRAAAEELARLNGGRVIRWSATAGEFEVTVGVGRAQETASAVGLAVGDSRRRALWAAVERLSALLGSDLVVVDAATADEMPPGAAPGIHVAPELAEEVARIGSRVGLCRPSPLGHPIHFELCRWTGPG